MERMQTDTTLPYVAISRGDDYYVFRYALGCESELISALIDCAENENLNFTWLDVLLIMRQLKM